MTPLNATTLARLEPAVSVPRYDRGAVRPGIVHFGVGNFFRVHQAVYVDDCLHRPGNEHWGIVGVGLLDGPASREKAAAFRAQDCLYSVTEYDAQGNPRVRVIGAMVEYLHAPADPQAVLARLADPAIRIVTMTITEGGYNIDEASGRFRLDNAAVARDLRGGDPVTVFGFIVEALHRRRVAGLGGLTVASCDNLRGSGDTIRKGVMSFAEARDPGLAAWIAGNVDFPNSMVDRLAPQIPPGTRRALNAASGLDDAVPAYTEAFTQWVVQDHFRYGRPPLEEVGVEFRENVAEYLALKGQLINAPHVFLSYPGLLAGYRIVSDALADPLLVSLVELFLSRDAVPTVKGPDGIDTAAFAAKFVPRFANKAIPDQLLRVAGDGAAKLPTFHGPILRALLAGGGDLDREAFLMACYGRYLAFALDPALRDDRGDRFDPFEPGLSASDWERVKAGPPGVLDVEALRPFGLADHAAFRAAFDRYVAIIAQSSCREAVKIAIARGSEAGAA